VVARSLRRVTYGQRARTTAAIRIRWIRVAGLVVVVAALTAAFGGSWPASSPSTATLTAAPPVDGPRAEPGLRALGLADGAIPDGTTVFDDGVPGVARLDPALLDALRRAASDAGIPFAVDSGWRSAAYQEHLLQQAVAKYGSEAQAARWVASPGTSEHVSGNAVDIKPGDATAWLAEHGAAYGLCRIYANEPWHFELRPQATAGGCPALYADPTHDPRMQK
jgi:D-alanyl-D-alanine carboxypeptidase